MPEPDPQVPLLAALIEFAQTQLVESWAEIRDQNTYALAVAALGVAVIGIVAATQSTLGDHWWVPVPGLAVTSFVALFGTRRVRPGFGPDPARFYSDHGEKTTKVALAQLLADLIDTQTKDVPSVLRRQRIALLVVAVLFTVTAIYSTLLLL